MIGSGGPWSGVVFGLVLAGSVRTAEACETEAPLSGLDVAVGFEDSRTIAADGVLAFDEYVHDMSVAAAMPALTVAVKLEGAPVAGEIEVQTLWSGVYDSGGVTEGTREGHQVLIVWRPAATLVAGTYAVTVTWESEFPEEREVALTVTAGSGPPPAAPDLAGGPEQIVAEVHARACCSTYKSSCGEDSLCQPIDVRHEPGFRFLAVAAPEQRERVVLWLAEVVDGEVGAPTYTHTAWPGWRGERPYFSQWPEESEVRFADARDEYCVVIGATSLIDGTSATSEPVCATMPAPHDEVLTPEFVPFDPETLEGRCLGPPVYEDNGRPYPAEEEGNPGCRSGDRGPWGLLLVGLLLRRRGRR